MRGVKHFLIIIFISCRLGGDPLNIKKTYFLFWGEVSTKMMNIMAMRWMIQLSGDWKYGRDLSESKKWTVKKNRGNINRKNPKMLHSFLLLNALWIMFYYSWDGISLKEFPKEIFLHFIQWAPSSPRRLLFRFLYFSSPLSLLTFSDLKYMALFRLFKPRLSSTLIN